MSRNKSIPRGFKKYLRRRKSLIRRQIGNPAEGERMIKELRRYFVSSRRFSK